MAIRTISRRGLQFHGSLFKELDSPNAMARLCTATTIRGFSSSSTKLNSFSRYIDDHRLDSCNSKSSISQLVSDAKRVDLDVALIRKWLDSINKAEQKLEKLLKLQKKRHFAIVQWETKKLRGDVEKVCIEIRHEIDKLAAAQRLEHHSVRDRLADIEFNLVKYCGTLSILAVCLALLCYN